MSKKNSKRERPESSDEKERKIKLGKLPFILLNFENHLKAGLRDWNQLLRERI